MAIEACVDHLPLALLLVLQPHYFLVQLFLALDDLGQFGILLMLSAILFLHFALSYQ